MIEPLTETEFDQWIEQWKKDIAFMDAEAQKSDYFQKHKMQIRVNAWNWLTCPSRPMTDYEHEICNTMAKYIWDQLQEMSGWRESDSGRLFY